MFLSLDQQENYQRDGFLIIRDFIAPSLCNFLISYTKNLINHFDASDIKTIFSTINKNHAKQLYFLDSGDKIRFFFEEHAFTENGELKSDKLLCINKIGHALHDLDPVFNCFSRLHKIVELVYALHIADPLLIQSMYICKQPFIGGEVICHQDSTYLFTEGKPITGLWFALEDATIDNGCLWAIPGGHHHKLKSRFFRDKNNQITTEIYDDEPWSTEKMQPLEVKQGSVIVLHGLLPHMSKANTSSRSRHAYTLHVCSAQDRFAADNWLQRTSSLPFRGFL